MGRLNYEPWWPGVLNEPVRSTVRHLDMLPAQPAHARPHLCPERTLHGIIDCRALESIGSTIERRQQEHEDLSPLFSVRAELRGPVLAECTNKEALARGQYI